MSLWWRTQRLAQTALMASLSSGLCARRTNAHGAACRLPKAEPIFCAPRTSPARLTLPMRASHVPCTPRVIYVHHTGDPPPPPPFSATCRRRADASFSRSLPRNCAISSLPAAAALAASASRPASSCRCSAAKKPRSLEMFAGPPAPARQLLPVLCRRRLAAARRPWLHRVLWCKLDCIHWTQHARHSKLEIVHYAHYAVHTTLCTHYTIHTEHGTLPTASRSN
jgi:hypothetical protein